MDIGASNWNESDTLNNTPAPDGAPEGMAPSGVDDTIRAVMGALKRWFNWSSPKITGGSVTAYTLTYGVVPGALVDGMTHLVQFHAVNGAGATSVSFGGAGGTITADSSTQITVTSPAGTGTVSVTVTTPGGSAAVAWLRRQSAGSMPSGRDRAPSSRRYSPAAVTRIGGGWPAQL